MLRGQDVARPETKHRSIGHSHVLGPEMRTQTRAYAVLHKLLQKAAMRLRSKNWYARSIYVKVKFVGSVRWKDHMTLSETQNTQELAHALTTLWDRRLYRTLKPFFVAVTLNDIISAQNHTPSLFGEVREEKLDALMDQLNRNYGAYTIYYAPAQDAIQKQAAPMRIPFSRIPDPESEAE